MQADKRLLSLAVLLVAMPALAARPGRVARIDRDHGHARPQRLVLDKAAQLAERPTRQPIARFPAPSPDPLPDARQFLDGNPACGAFGGVHDALADAVVDVLVSAFHRLEAVVHGKPARVIQSDVASGNQFRLPPFDGEVRGKFVAQADDSAVAGDNPDPGKLSPRPFAGLDVTSTRHLGPNPGEKVRARRGDGEVEAAYAGFGNAHVDAALTIEDAGEVPLFRLRQVTNHGRDFVLEITCLRLLANAKLPGTEPYPPKRAVRQELSPQLTGGHSRVVVPDDGVFFRRVVRCAAHDGILRPRHVVSKLRRAAKVGFLAGNALQFLLRPLGVPALQPLPLQVVFAAHVLDRLAAVGCAVAVGCNLGNTQVDA